MDQFSVESEESAVGSVCTVKPPASQPARAESAVMASGAVAAGVGILAELAAPAWPFLPAWLHPLLSANEGLIIAGAAVFGVAALIRRARRRVPSGGG
jgi:hypothetical protein